MPDRKIEFVARAHLQRMRPFARVVPGTGYDFGDRR